MRIDQLVVKSLMMSQTKSVLVLIIKLISSPVFYPFMQLFRRMAVLLVAGAIVSSAQASEVTGAGATFPYPVYAKWAEAYKAAVGQRVNYQSVGSGAGIKQIKAKTVDFGASDMPLSAADLAAAGLVQFPAIMGGLVPVIHLDGIAAGQLHLTGEVVADIYMGKITQWNAVEIAQLNPSVKLPATSISVVHRSDGSGSTFLWTDYLSKVSPAFKAAVGSGRSVKWPVGVGGKGNEGLAANVMNIKGSIGYVEYAFVKKNHLKFAQLKNHDGYFVAPDDATFKAAANGAEWNKIPGYGVILTNQPGKASWPVTGASFILMQKSQSNAEKAKAMLKFFDWAYKNGGALAAELDYVPMPPDVVAMVEHSWKTEITDVAGKPVW